MIIRISLFTSLLALFYYYCKEDSVNQYRQPNDLNLMEVPAEISPSFYYDDLPQKTMNYDSSINLITAHQNYIDNTDILHSSASQNY